MAADRNELTRRARSAVYARVPPCVRDGSVNVSVKYTAAAAVCSSFLAGKGTQLGRVQAAVEALERFQGLR